MPNALILNGHQPFPTSPGRLNASFVSRGEKVLRERGFEVQTVKTAAPFEIDAEVDRQLWADFILVQFPVNSMGMPWSLKRYLDEVYTAGMDGRLAKGDGRTRSDPAKQYGSGGKMQGRTYMLSVTLNAPVAAFDDPSQILFGGRSIDELLAPAHINFAFFGMSAQETFAAYDVSKAPTIEADFERFEKRLRQTLGSLS